MFCLGPVGVFGPDGSGIYMDGQMIHNQGQQHLYLQNVELWDTVADWLEQLGHGSWLVRALGSW